MVGRLVSKQPPWSMAMSTTTLPGRIEAIIPGAVARTSTLALTSATLPYLVRVADHGVTGAAAADPALRHGLSTLGGKLVTEPVAEAHGLPFTDPAEIVAER